MGFPFILLISLEGVHRCPILCSSYYSSYIWTPHSIFIFNNQINTSLKYYVINGLPQSRLLGIQGPTSLRTQLILQIDLMTLNCMYMRSCRTKFSSLSNLVSCDLQFNTYIDQHNIVIWRFVPHCLMWCIWREWNSRSFEGREQSIIKLKSFFFFSLLKRCLVLPSFSCFSLPVLLDHCNLGSLCYL